MSRVAVECPKCRRCRVYNGRGRCACGAYLIVIEESNKRGVPISKDENTWVRWDGTWMRGYDFLNLAQLGILHLR